MCLHFFFHSSQEMTDKIVWLLLKQFLSSYFRNMQLKVIILVSLIKCPTFSGGNYCCDCPFNCGAQATKLSGICAQAPTLQKILLNKLSRLSLLKCYEAVQGPIH